MIHVWACEKRWVSGTSVLYGCHLVTWWPIFIFFFPWWPIFIFIMNYLTLFCRIPASRRRGLQSTETFGFVSGLPTGNQTSMTIPAPALLPSGNSAQVDAGCQNLVTTLMSGSACSGGHLQFDFAEWIYVISDSHTICSVDSTPTELSIFLSLFFRQFKIDVTMCLLNGVKSQSKYNTDKILSNK